MTDGSYERELVRAFRAVGYEAMRCPASGGGTAADLPDVVAAKPSPASTPSATVLTVELKTTRSDFVYVDGCEVAALKRFSSRFGGVPVIGVKFKTPGVRRPYRLVPPANCYVTPAGTHRVRRQTADEASLVDVWTPTDKQDADIVVNEDAASDEMRASHADVDIGSVFGGEPDD